MCAGTCTCNLPTRQPGDFFSSSFSFRHGPSLVRLFIFASGVWLNKSGSGRVISLDDSAVQPFLHFPLSAPLSFVPLCACTGVVLLLLGVLCRHCMCGLVARSLVPVFFASMTQAFYSRVSGSVKRECGCIMECSIAIVNQTRPYQDTACHNTQVGIYLAWVYHVYPPGLFFGEEDSTQPRQSQVFFSPPFCQATTTQEQ